MMRPSLCITFLALTVASLSVSLAQRGRNIPGHLRLNSRNRGGRPGATSAADSFQQVQIPEGKFAVQYSARKIMGGNPTDIKILLNILELVAKKYYKKNPFYTGILSKIYFR